MGEVRRELEVTIAIHACMENSDDVDDVCLLAIKDHV